VKAEPPDSPDDSPEVEPPDRTAPLDMSKDPDRFPAAGQGQSLPDLLGKSGTYEGERDNYQWAFGLLAVFAFLAAVAFLFGSVLSPP
jgi:hypothetical protein